MSNAPTRLPVCGALVTANRYMLCSCCRAAGHTPRAAFSYGTDRTGRMASAARAAAPPAGPAGAGPGTPPAPAQRSSRRPRRKGIALGPGILLGCMGIVTVLVRGFLITAWLVYDHYSNKLEEQIAALETLTDSSSFENTVIFDRDGQELYQVFDEGLRTRIPDR